MEKLRKDAESIVSASIGAVLPDEAVRRALEDFEKPAGKTIIVSVGKAAWQMAKTASDIIGEGGIVITKYGHSAGDIPGIRCFEAGHPVPDENGFAAAAEVLDAVSGLTERDAVVFLLSGGGSALFEKPLIPGEELQDITGQLLAAGADIVEINTIRKRLSGVKGGRFALACAPAKVFSIVLNDILDDRPDMIASGPACPDTSTCADAARVAEKYGLRLSADAMDLLGRETPKTLDNVEMKITGSVSELCRAAAAEAERLGYETCILTDRLCCEASEAGSFLGSVARSHAESANPLAFIAGGETVVHLKGDGLGGRNQEIALSAAAGIRGLDAAVFSFGSDGTDGPTDAAGGYADGKTIEKLEELGIDAGEYLARNDSYHALDAADGLIKTGPTGTNVNDVSVVLIP